MRCRTIVRPRARLVQGGTGSRRPNGDVPVALRLVLLVVLLATPVATLSRAHGTAAPPAGAQEHVPLTAAQRAGTLRFAPGTSPVDEQVVLGAIAAARPEARRLIDLVDGAVTVTVGPTGEREAAGLTRPGPDGYAVTLDLGTVSRWLGTRGTTRLVLHELGHVVDFALLSPDLRARLDAGIPPGYPCAPGDQASCVGRSAREERFAETFAKWATGDIGVGLDIGYQVLPPDSLDAWGAPLTALR